MGRPDKIRSALLDASALIGVIKGEPEFACLKPLLAAVDRGEIALVESTAILAEVQPAHGTDPSRHARDTVRALLESPATQLIDVSTAVARKAGELRGKHGLKTWGCGAFGHCDPRERRHSHRPRPQVPGGRVRGRLRHRPI